MEETLKRTAKQPGKLRELVDLLKGLWKEDLFAFEELLAGTVSCWKTHEKIPLALRILITENDDAGLRNSIIKTCESSGTPSTERQTLYFVAALWGDEWAKNTVREHLELTAARVLRSGKGLSDLLLAQMRSAMVGHYSNNFQLQELRSSVEKAASRTPENLAMINALGSLHQVGFSGLAEQLNRALEGKRKVTDSEIWACWLLGTAGVRQNSSVFGKILERVSGTDWWSVNFRTRSLSSLAYSTALGYETITVVERYLKSVSNKMSSWWHGGNWTADLIAICAVLWNDQRPLSQPVVECLESISCGRDKYNAQEAIALLLLKGREIPQPSKFPPDDPSVLFCKDARQYDSVLNLTYYWRCNLRPKPS